MDITVIIAVFGCVLSVATFFVGRTTAAKNSGVADGELRADIKYIKLSVEKQDKKLDEIATNYKDLELEIERLWGELKALEQRVNMFHGE